MKAFITGGGGFLGTYIVKELLKEGHEVISYSRGHYPHLEELGVHCIQGSLNDKEKILKATKGIDVIFHTASKVAMWGKYEDFHQTNVVGTQNILFACKENQIKHLIYTSTPSVVFGKDSLSGVDEKTPYPKNSVSRYAKTKAIAEDLVLKTDKSQLKAVSLRPHLIFGPGDKNLIPRLLDRARKKKLKIIGSGLNQVDVLYVENAAKAHIKAWHALLENKPVAGEAFFIGQGPVKLWSFINEILAKKDIQIIEKKIPFTLTYTIGGVFELLYQIFGIFKSDPPMTRFVALQLNCDHYFNHQKAHQLLGWKPEISIEEGLSRLVASEFN